MLLIPAIDLRQGKCVRLRQGRMDEYTVFADDPLQAAKRWVKAGARRLHIVDLDGAVDGRPMHSEVVARLVTALPHVVVQVGGGIRSVHTATQYLNTGVRYVVIGTRAVSDGKFLRTLCKKFPGRIIAGLDVRDGHIAVEGWRKVGGDKKTPLQIAQRFEQDGAAAIIYTDINRDGMLCGVNVEATAALARAVCIPLIASGGISNIDDIHALGAVCQSGIHGAIVGRAIYEGTLDFAKGLHVAKRYEVHSDG